MKLIREACVETKEEIIKAAHGGADRFELCEYLQFGGLTPRKSLINFTIKNTAVPTVTMIRRRSVGFTTNAFDLLRLKIDIIQRRKMNIAGFVFGILTKDKKINVKSMESLIKLCKEKEVVFHMAFDEIANKEEALETLIKLRVKRVLTKGGSGTAMENIDTLKKLHEQARGRIQIIAGGKITADNYLEICNRTGLNQVHGRKLVN